MWYAIKKYRHQERREGTGPVTARQPGLAAKVPKPARKGNDAAQAEQPKALPLRLEGFFCSLLWLRGHTLPPGRIKMIRKKPFLTKLGSPPVKPFICDFTIQHGPSPTLKDGNYREPSWGYLCAVVGSSQSFLPAVV